MTILITGATGFVGSYLENVWSDHHVDLIGVTRSPKLPNHIDWETFWKGKQRASVYIHAAGKAHDTSDKGVSEEYFKINTELTRKAWEMFISDPVSHTFIYFSSVKAAANKVVGVLSEEDSFPIDTSYGVSKRKAEMYLLEQKLPSNKRLIILRPCMIHGPGNKGNLNLLYQLVSKKIPFPLGAFENERSFLSIDNLVFVLEELIKKKEIPSGVYNLSDDGYLSTNQVVSIIGQSLSFTAKIWSLSPNLIQKMAKIGDFISLFPLSSLRLNKLTESYRVSNAKIKKALGVTSMPVSAKEGLLKTLESFRKKS